MAYQMKSSGKPTKKFSVGNIKKAAAKRIKSKKSSIKKSAFGY